MSHPALRALALSGVLSGFVVIGGSCGRPGGGAPLAAHPTARPPTTEPIGRHWIQDQRLRVVMADVSRRMRENYPSRLPDDPEQPTSPDLGSTLDDASTLARELARAAERIPRAIEGNAAIAEADRAGFLEEARTLRRHALDLSAAASEGRVEAMQRSLLGINATCIACHSRYKDVSGELADLKQARRDVAQPRLRLQSGAG